MSKTTYMLQIFGRDTENAKPSRVMFKASKEATAIKRYEKTFYQDRCIRSVELYEFTGAPLGWVHLGTMARMFGSK